MTDRIEVQIAADATGLVREADRAGGALQDFGRIVDRVGGIAGSVKTDFALLGTAFIGVQGAVQAAAAAFNTVTQAFKDMNAEVIDAESVASRLAATFDDAEASAGRLAAQANKLAGGTVFFDDDAIKNAAAVLRSFELTESEIRKLLPAAINLATVFGTDLNSASERLANGLTGSTRGLREFGIVVKEGSDRSAILAEILARGERAAAGAALAQEGLRGKTAALKTAQGEFNQALGELLSGPNQAFLQFLTDATKKATELTAGMSGAAAEAARVTKVFDPKSGAIREAPAAQTLPSSLPAGLQKQLQEAGILKVDPIEKARREAEQKARADKAREEEEKRKAAADKRKSGGAAGRQSAAGGQGFGPGLELGAGVNVMKAIGAAQLAAETKAIQNNEKYKEEQSKKRMEELLKASAEAAKLLEEGTKNAADGIVSAGRLLVDVLQGNATLGSVIRSLSGLASTAGGLFGGPLGAALAGIGVEVTAAIVDGFKPQQTAADKLRIAGEKLTEAGTVMTEAERQRRIEQAKSAARTAGLTDTDIARALEAARSPVGVPSTKATAATRRTQGLVPLGDLGTVQLELPNRTPEQNQIDFLLNKPLVSPALGDLKAEPLPSFVTGIPGQGALSPGAEAIPAGQLAFQDTGPAFNELVRILRELVNAQLDDAGRGLTERAPLYVYDVAPSKDEFSRAPRGLFFRPVGVDRGVSGGQSLSGVTSGTTNRSSGTGSRSYGSGSVRRLG